MKITKLILTIVIIIAFLTESTGQSFALRPMATRPSPKKEPVFSNKDYTLYIMTPENGRQFAVYFAGVLSQHDISIAQVTESSGESTIRYMGTDTNTDSVKLATTSNLCMAYFHDKEYPANYFLFLTPDLKRAIGYGTTDVRNGESQVAFRIFEEYRQQSYGPLALTLLIDFMKMAAYLQPELNLRYVVFPRLTVFPDQAIIDMALETKLPQFLIRHGFETRGDASEPMINCDFVYDLWRDPLSTKGAARANSAGKSSSIEQLRQRLQQSIASGDPYMAVDQLKYHDYFISTLSQVFFQEFFSQLLFAFMSDDKRVTEADRHEIEQAFLEDSNPYDAMLEVVYNRPITKECKVFIAQYLLTFSFRRGILPIGLEKYLFRYYFHLQQNVPVIFKTRYQFIRLIAAGHEGIVFEVRDLHRNENYAIKLIEARRKRRAELFRRRFVEEKLNPRVVHNHEIGIIGNYCYVVKDLLKGVEFDCKCNVAFDCKYSFEVLKRKGFTPIERIAILIEVIDGLKELMGPDYWMFPGDFQFFIERIDKEIKICFFDYGKWEAFGPETPSIDNDELFVSGFELFYANMLRLATEDNIPLTADPQYLEDLIHRCDAAIGRPKPECDIYGFDLAFTPHLFYIRGLLYKALGQEGRAEADFADARRRLSNSLARKELRLIVGCDNLKGQVPLAAHTETPATFQAIATSA